MLSATPGSVPGACDSSYSGVAQPAVVQLNAGLGDRLAAPPPERRTNFLARKPEINRKGMEWVPRLMLLSQSPPQSGPSFV